MLDMMMFKMPRGYGRQATLAVILWLMGNFVQPFDVLSSRRWDDPHH